VVLAGHLLLELHAGTFLRQHGVDGGVRTWAGFHAQHPPAWRAAFVETLPYVVAFIELD
jgi:hypothetical protein